jgi:hypothetical protein
VKATSIVDGIQRQSRGSAETVHLNLLSKAGREIGTAYGVNIIPATLVFDSAGEILYRRNGFPEQVKLQQIVAE